MPTPFPPLLSAATGAHPGQGQVPLGCDTSPAPAPPSDRGCCAPASPFGIFPPSLCTGSWQSPSPVLRCSPPASSACSPGSACSRWKTSDPRPDQNTSGTTEGAPRRAPRPRCSWRWYGCTEPSCISCWDFVLLLPQPPALLLLAGESKTAQTRLPSPSCYIREREKNGKLVGAMQEGSRPAVPASTQAWDGSGKGRGCPRRGQPGELSRRVLRLQQETVPAGDTA